MLIICFKTSRQTLFIEFFIDIFMCCLVALHLIAVFHRQIQRAQITPWNMVQQEIFRLKKLIEEEEKKIQQEREEEELNNPMKVW